MKTSPEDITVLLVGGGSIVAPDELAGVKEIVLEEASPTPSRDAPRLPVSSAPATFPSSSPQSPSPPPVHVPQIHRSKDIPRSLIFSMECS